MLTILNRTDAVLFRFLEKYLSQLEGPVANQVWNRFMQLVKEVTTGLKDLKLQGYFALRFAANSHFASAHDSPDSRCLTVLADKVVQTAALDDRRLRKELQVRCTVRHYNYFRLNPIMEENYGKLVDSCVISVSRLDPGTWIRRTTKETLSVVNGRDSPIPRGTPIVFFGGLFLIFVQSLLMRNSRKYSLRTLRTANSSPRPRLANRYSYLPPGSP